MSRVVFAQAEKGLPTDAPLIRWDLAWPLFLPDCEAGSLPEQQPQLLNIMGRWYWEQMGTVSGRLRADACNTVFFVTPRLSDAAREYLTRLASFWCDEVYWEPPTDSTPNRWQVPAVDLGKLPADPLWAAMTESYPEAVEHSLVPMIGIGRLYMKVQEVAAGAASARIHSHTAQDEYYLILKGSGTLRMGQNSRPVSAGTFIAKPTGPHLTSHIVADQGEPVTILDMEVYADSRIGMGTYDVMAYTDHQEIVLAGLGLEGMVPQKAFGPTDDVFGHYFDGYVRESDGTVRAETFPGHPPRPMAND